MRNRNIIQKNSEAPFWNIEYQLNGLKAIGLAGIIATSIITIISEGKTEDNNSTVPKSIVQAIWENRHFYKNLPIIEIWNPDEMNTLKTSWKDGLYYFQDWIIVVYMIKNTGIVQTNTFKTQ